MAQSSSPTNRKLCNHCGGDRIIADANAVWDVNQQCWVLDDVFDDYFCSDCEGESTPIDAEVAHG